MALGGFLKFERALPTSPRHPHARVGGPVCLSRLRAAEYRFSLRGGLQAAAQLCCEPANSHQVKVSGPLKAAQSSIFLNPASKAPNSIQMAKLPPDQLVRRVHLFSSIPSRSY